MPNAKPSLLIADDSHAILTSLSCVLREVGYRVRTAEDGFAALAEMRSEIPEILISDLNMPGMSGFELLAVVRREFPEVKTIAMSGSFCGEEARSGLPADAFYQKGSSMASLLRIMENLPVPERKHEGSGSDGSPARMPGDGHGGLRRTAGHGLVSGMREVVFTRTESICEPWPAGSPHILQERDFPGNQSIGLPTFTNKGQPITGKRARNAEFC